ncbi:hypothetical protein ABTO68_19810, partial [Acinetobacter baumannii]
VRGESELIMTDTAITTGDYTAGIYNRWNPGDSGLVEGSRSTLNGVDLTVGDKSIGLWASGSPSRLEATDSVVNAGDDSWGVYSSS